MLSYKAGRPSGRAGEIVTRSDSATSDEIDLGRLFGHLLDGKWWILAITGLFMALGVGYALLATPVYKANALLQVEKKASGTALLSNVSELLGSEQPDSAAEIQLLSSRMVLGRAVDSLQLDNEVSAKFLPLIGEGLDRLQGHPAPKMALSRFEVPAELLGVPLALSWQGHGQFSLDIEGQTYHGQVGEPFTQAGINLLISEVAANNGQQFILQKQPVLGVIGELQRNLQVSEKGKNTGIIALTLEGTDKARIQAVLNSISQHYLQQNVLRKTEEAQKSLDFLSEHLPQVKGELNRAEEQLNIYRQQNESVDLSLEAKAALDTMVAIEKQLNDLTFREAELQQLYTRQHPAYVALLDKRQTLINTKNSINKSIKRLPKTQQEILRLTRDVQVGQEIFVQLLNKQQELNIMKAGTVGNVRIIDEAVSEAQPVKPKKPLIVVLATLLGAMFSVGIILLRAAFHRGIENAEQLEEMGLSVYATIPFSDEQAKIEQQQKSKRKAVLGIQENLLAAKNPADLAMESLRSLRTSLHFAMLEAKNNIVMISGPAPALGKTFVSTNFAATLAMGGKKVLVIDADLRKGYMQKIMGKLMGPGLSNYLSGQSQMAEVITKTGFEGLDFICRGAIPPNPSELLMHPRFKMLLDWGSEKYDFVIIDSPPILAVTDAAVIGQHVGASLLVARFAKTSAKEVEVAVRRFEQNGVPIKGVLINAVERKASSYYGGYGYYQYSYADKEKGKKKAEPS